MILLRTELPIVVSTWAMGVKANEAAAKAFQGSGSSLDAVEAGIKTAEDDPEVTSVGYGGYPNEDGVVQLDAAIMSGPDHRVGAVAGLEGIANPISLARKVLERTQHVLLVGQGAQQFALKTGFQKTNLLTEKSLQGWRDREASFWQNHDTIGLVLLDTNRDLYAGCSTSGLFGKISGRVGDSPIVGHGLYVDNAVGAASATGMGEVIMRYCASFLVVEYMRQGLSPRAACVETVKRMSERGERGPVALIALNKQGEYGAGSLGKNRFPYAVLAGGENVLLEVEGYTNAT